MLISMLLFFSTLHWTKSPSFGVIIVSAGGAPQQVVLASLRRALRVPLVVVLEGQSTWHTMCVSQQSVYFCHWKTPNVNNPKQLRRVLIKSTLDYAAFGWRRLFRPLTLVRMRAGSFLVGVVPDPLVIGGFLNHHRLSGRGQFPLGGTK